jgi:hypothetical protein
MTESEKVINQELQDFKTQSAASALTSFSNSLVFFLFSQWAKEHFEDKKERKHACDQVFKQWSDQIYKSAAPVFVNINQSLNDPKTRWQNIISDTHLSTESYQEQFTAAIREIKVQFDNVIDKE